MVLKPILLSSLIEKSLFKAGAGNIAETIEKILFYFKKNLFFYLINVEYN
jgi:hypothetical protein